MRSRRHFIRLAFLALTAPLVGSPRRSAEAQYSTQVFLPLVAGPPLAANDDMALLAPASGARAQATAWLAARCAAEYTPYDVDSIAGRYQRLGDSVGLDWFLALAQMAHETGHLTSWWSGRPRRNPAGIGVTGVTQAGSADIIPGAEWSWDDRSGLWRAGWSFPTWADHAAPAHIGRLLAYALRDEDATPAQRELIDYALSYRPLPEAYRGAAPTIAGLNGKWAVPGVDYGQRIVDLARRMRQA
jgi:hypothetical protein